MPLHGLSSIAGRPAPGGKTFRAVNPASGNPLDPEFHEALPADLAEAARSAAEAFGPYRSITGAARAAFLERIAGEIEALGDALIDRCILETGLPAGRLAGERARTCGQLRLFASLAREGSWVDARIDTALPDRKPLPRPDLRRMLIALGPVAIFGASNFPLAFSTAGGDTASALAAGCPVIVKAHPAHPGTSELVASAVLKAIQACGLPGGVFSLLHGGAEAGAALVRRPEIAAAAFTGSHAAGRALFDAAALRPAPIPVFSEMSSVNPLIILPGALGERSMTIAKSLLDSVTLGVGQFCTKPGLIFVQSGEAADGFIARLAGLIGGCPKGVMLTPNIRRGFEKERGLARAAEGVTALGPDGGENAGGAEASFTTTSAAHFLKQPELSREIFGPFFLVVLYGSDEELSACLGALEGQLTATLHVGAEEIAPARRWIGLLERKVGRVIVNGFPTGVEVCPAMNHGGPYPATTDARFTSVGTAAILRFARPVCYQDVPAPLLPLALRDENPLEILRLVNGAYSRQALIG